MVTSWIFQRSARVRALLLGGGALFFAYWFGVASTRILALPENLNLQFTLLSEDRFYDPVRGVFRAPESTTARLSYATGVVAQGIGTLPITANFSVRRAGGDQVIDLTRSFTVDPDERGIRSTSGEAEASGYVIPPRNLQKRPFLYWHVNYDSPARMEFVDQEIREGLIIYRYRGQVRADQTDHLSHLPGVPESRGVRVDSVLDLWIEPTSGWPIEFADHAEAYFYDRTSGERMEPWNSFSNTVAATTVAHNLERAREMRHRILLIDVLLPLFLTTALLVGLGLSYGVYGGMIVAGVSTLAVGALVIVGWHVSWRELNQLHESFVPMKYNTALGFIFAGIGVLALTAPSRRTLTVWIGIALAILGVVSVTQNLLGINFGVDELLMRDYFDTRNSNPGRMAPNTAVCFALLGGALLAFSYPRRTRWREWAWILPAIILGLSLTAVVGYLGRWESAFRWGRFTEIAYSTALLFLGLSITVMAFECAQLRPRHRARAIAGVMAILGLVSSVAVYSVVTVQEREVWRRVVSERSGLLAHQIRDAIELRLSTLQRMSRRWILEQGTSEERWRSDARNYLSDLPGVSLMAWMDPGRTIRWVESTGDVDDATLRNAFPLPPPDAPSTESGDTILSTVREIESRGGYLLGSIPLGSSYQKGGTLLMVMSVATIVDSLVSETVRDFGVRLSEEGKEIYRSDPRPSADYLRSGFATVKVGSIVWTLEGTALGGESARIQKIPLVVAGVYAAFGLLATVVIWLYLRSREESRRAIETSEFFNSVLDHLPIMVFIKDAKHLRFVHLNRAGEELLGIRRGDLIGKSDYDLFPSEQAEFFVNKDRTVLERNELMDVPEEEIQTRNHGVRWLHTRKVPLVTSNGQGFLIGLSEDITARRCVDEELTRARDEAVRASRVKSEFLANMSHEIRTPMNGVIGMTDLLLETPLTPDQCELAHTVKESARALLTIINDILDFSKVEAGKLVLAPIPFKLSEFVSQLERIHVARFQEKRISFISEVERGTPEVLVGDVDRLRQVVINLLGNALKFTSPGGAIVLRISPLRTTPESVELQFSITDTGIGIPEEKQAQIFEAFSQGDSSTTRAFGGTGLGLSIASQLVKLMGGEVGVSSQPGAGSVFYFTAIFALPSGEVRAEPTEEVAPSATPSPHLHGARVLLAEDNPTNQKLATKLLERAGCSVNLARTGTEAVELVGRDSFDIILMDIQMPEMNGEEAIRTIRKMSGGANPPIIALTAHAMAGDKERYLAMGADGYVSKPLDRHMLFATMESLLKARAKT